MKDKQFSLLNILGLSAGLACALLIVLWVNDELRFDRFFAHEDRMYKLFQKASNNSGDVFYSEESSGRLSEAVKQSVPGVEYAAAVAPPGWFPQITLSANERNIKASGQYAEKDYFNIFSFPLLAGDRNEVLATRSSIVLSDELAQKLFGTTDNIVGKAVDFNHDTTFFVSGVFKKMPVNSSQQFDFVLSFDYYATVASWVKDWGASGPLNYVLLKPHVNVDDFNRNVRDVIGRNRDDSVTKVFAMKFSDVYLHNNYNGNVQSGGRIEYVKLFSLLAIFIIVIACINFMNLSTAKAARRFKEVGIKKVVGARRGNLVMQFLTESVLLTFFAMLIAILLAALLLPAFNSITDKQIALHFSWQMIVAILGIILITGFVAGSYPALYISRFNPLNILKGKLNSSAAEILSRKGLVVFQFALSTILIIAVFIIYQQIQFIQNADPGFNKSNVLRMAAEGNLAKKQGVFISELKKLPGVHAASATDHRMVGHNFASYALDWPGRNPDESEIFEIFGVDYEFIETMGMHILEGRSFSRSYGSDSSAIIINESAAQAMNMKDPVGKIVKYFGHDAQIIGVVKDFHFESMHEPIKPSVLNLVQHPGTVIASIKGDNQQATVKAIQKLYEAFNPEFPFTFNFLDEAYQKQYESETKVSVLSKYFAGLAIIISCLGLFGLAAFTAQRRRKEIGVRKVIGASAAGITFMLSKDFLKLVGVALLIAFPLAWWLMTSWLENFAYRVTIHPSIFVLTACVVVVITICTIGYQSVKAAMANPVNSLRTE